MALTYLLTYLLIQLGTAQYDTYHKLTYPEEMWVYQCHYIYDTRDITNLAPRCDNSDPHTGKCQCVDTVWHTLLLEETTTDIGFNLTDHSSLDFTIDVGQAYLFTFIKFRWQYRNHPINQATSYVSLYDAGLHAWVPHDYRYVAVDGSGSAIRVNGTINDKVVSQLHFHLEWNFDSPTGIVQPSGIELYGETQTQFPTAEPSRS
eukprot:21914_1